MMRTEDEQSPPSEAVGSGTPDDPYYPQIHVHLGGLSGSEAMNAVVRAMWATEFPNRDVDQFRDEALSDDKAHLFHVISCWVVVK